MWVVGPDSQRAGRGSRLRAENPKSWLCVPSLYHGKGSTEGAEQTRAGTITMFFFKEKPWIYDSPAAACIIDPFLNAEESSIRLASPCISSFPPLPTPRPSTVWSSIYPFPWLLLLSTCPMSPIQPQHSYPELTPIEPSVPAQA